METKVLGLARTRKLLAAMQVGRDRLQAENAELRRAPVRLTEHSCDEVCAENDCGVRYEARAALADARRGA